MASFLMGLAVLSGIVGMALISQATLGVGFVAGGCLLAICARMSQAEAQHKETLKLLSNLGGIRGHAKEAVKVLRQAHNLPEDDEPAPEAPKVDPIWR